MRTSGLDRNILLLAVCQAMFMTSTSAVLTSTALVGKSLASYGGFATWPMAFQFAAMMATTFPASMYMKRVGRRVGFITGALIGITGGLISTLAIHEQSFWLFCLGSACLGSFNAFAHYFRFAAADVADPMYRSRAISYVLVGGVVAAVAGPTLANQTVDLFAPVTYAGIFFVIIGLHLGIIGLTFLIRFPRPTEAERQSVGRPLARIARHPKFIVAVLGAVIGYVVMSVLMTITPVAMVDHLNFGFGDSAFVIQGHVLGMYLPSFFTGYLIARWGVTNVMITGALAQALCVAVNLSGTGIENFALSLFLVGVGWNFLFIGGTTLLTEVYTPAEKAKAQGFNDFCIWGFVTVGAIISGAAIHELGWATVNMAVAPLILLTLGATLWFKLSGRDQVAPNPVS